MRLEIEQKLHAASDPHKRLGSISDRARDVANLLLLGGLIAVAGIRL
jgi:hypothetical protein